MHTSPRTRSPPPPRPPTDPDGTKSRAEAGAWFEKEVLALLPDLYATALRFTGHGADAEDLVADTVARGWAHLPELNERARLRGWIFRILANTWISQLRALRVRPAQEALPADDCFSLFERVHQPFLLWGGNPEQELLSKLLREDLESAIQALPEAFRAVVVLADVQGFSYREISDTLGIPVGTVRSRLARGRSRLQKALWEQAREAGLVAEPPAAHPDDNGAV